MRPLLLVGAIFLLFGCQQSPALAPAQGSLESLTARLKEEGDALTAQGQYRNAVAKYQLALGQEPGDVSLRFALGVALSHSERRQETVEQFRWVVNHGRPGSQEVEAARQWLASAGEIIDPRISRTSFNQEHAGTSTLEASGSTSKVGGRLEWNGVDAKEQRIVVLVSLAGEDSSNRKVKLTRSSRLGQRYGLGNVPAGNYRLTVQARGSEIHLWNQRLTVEAGKDVVLDLNNSNSLVRPEALPTNVERD